MNSSEDAVFRTFNFATQAKRSPGSTIKPLVAYAPAVAAGWQLIHLWITIQKPMWIIPYTTMTIQLRIPFQCTKL